MTRQIIKALRESGIDCLPNERFSLDVEMFPENGQDSSIPAIALFEKPELKEGKRRIEDHDGSFFRYFLDGSQRSWRVIEANIKGHYLPFCAGQVGVAVLKRDDGRFSPIRELTTVRNVLAVPDLIGKDEIPDIAEKINAELDENQHFTIVQYNYTSKADKDPGDLGRAMIIDEMQREELRTIRKMIQESMIGDRAMLAKDGDLQYRKDKRDKELSLSRDDIVQLRNVITGEEKDEGIRRERADTLSSYVLAERNVMPYNADARWATPNLSHLSPGNIPAFILSEPESIQSIQEIQTQC
uniref:Uncharacterized protein n=1 Tax=Candidatus Kentrum sp. MB TaxID=2138164 RepID=A0A451BDK9_9GAMM|nr:MAG: hypothetical protein BECKMB1821G_GA0114241_101729 [Candidatus Kentron sp. MB]VFK33761.1 MAG: hypothetical protein BECKMB1821I_GA0114274_10534 [Candidatus Kentron sp. MB]VFK76369.1 MAG: hypothetical protein BECKMB1821H_GA0114242_10544 [Candidatus Kentron sp. MB]